MTEPLVTGGTPQPPVGLSATADGVMHYMRADNSKRPCSCCWEGRHVFALGVEVIGEQAFEMPGTHGMYPADLKDWIYRQYHQIPDGARVRVTVEAVEVMHCDKYANRWEEGVQRLTERLPGDYESADWSGSYGGVTGPHLDADCPFKDGDVPMDVAPVEGGVLYAD